MSRTVTNTKGAARRVQDAPAKPKADVHVVKSGDNMWDIAKKHQVSLDELMNANPRIKERGGLIFAGTEVKIPASAAQGREAAASRTQAAAAMPAAERIPASASVQNATRARAAANEDSQRQNAIRSVSNAPSPARGIRPVQTQAQGATELNRGADASPTAMPDVRLSDVRAPVNVRSTKNMNEAQKYDFYRNLVESKGGEFHRGKRTRNIIGLRKETNPNANGGRGADDDRFVMAWIDRDGNKRVREYNGTTEGSERNRQNYSSDVNRDGRNDLGRIPNGYYEYGVSTSARLGDVLRPTKAFRVQRDFNQDGRYTGRERRADTSSAFLFHKGSSAGCQTMDSSNWKQFWSDLNSSGRPKKIGYTLLNV
jgi:LysM repeat protein